MLKTAFITPNGSYALLKMAFGIVNSGATLVRALRRLRGDNKEADSFIDDILFSHLSSPGLRVKPSKCLIGAESIEFIGHKISAHRMNGLHQEHMKKIRSARRPNTKKEVKAFLRLRGYYREFIPNYATN